MFFQRAGATILTMMVIVWFLASSRSRPPAQRGPAINYSLAAMIGHALAPLLHQLGFNWQIVVALIAAGHRAKSRSPRSARFTPD